MRLIVKKIIFLFCASLFFFSTGVYSNENEQVVKVSISSPTYEEAVKISKIENKKIFLLFYGEYCGPCNKIKEELTKPEVLRILDNYVVCYVDLLKEKELRKKYNINSVPTFFILDQNEKIIKKNSGYKDSVYLSNWLTESVIKN